MTLLLQELEPSPVGIFEDEFKTKKGERKINIRNHFARYFFIGTEGSRDEDFPDDMEYSINEVFSTKPVSRLTRIFCLRVFLGKSYAEISQIVGVSTPLVRGYFHTAKKRALRVIEALCVIPFRGNPASGGKRKKGRLSP